MLIGAGTTVYVAEGAIDMRKSIDGLAALVQASLLVSPLSGALFVFFNRGRDKVKLLWWDRHGFWLAYKRLERGRFRLPVTPQLTLTDLMLVLEGIDPSVRRLKRVTCQRVA
jgi:transposase